MWLKVAVVVLIVAMILHGRSRWQTSMKDLQTSMQAVHAQTSINTFDPREITDLPAPVQRYFGAVLKDGQLEMRVSSS